MDGAMKLKTIPLEQIRFDARNPRTDGEGSVDELAASLRGAGLVQLPIVIEEEGGYRVLVGERRVRAAHQAGLEEIPCLVSDPLDPIAAHRFRVAENLHRRELNPIDHAQALRTAWLLANAEALGLEKQAGRLMKKQRPLSSLLPDLERLLAEHGFRPTAPAVTWERLLDELGIEMAPARRKKLMQVLALSSEAQEIVRELPVTEAAVRALTRLGEDDLRKVADAIQENPDLARRARRIARAVHDQGYTAEEAIAEARGEFIAPNPGEPVLQPEYEGDRTAQDAVLLFLEATNSLLATLEAVRQIAPQSLDLPDPWRGYFQNALEALRSRLDE
jgi:hypothetical protein